MLIEQYGLQQDDTVNVTWLLQESGATNVVGLKESNLHYRIPRGYQCSHNIKLVQTAPDLYERIKDFEIVKLFAPILYRPEEHAVYIVTSGLEDSLALAYMMQLNCPNRKVSFAADNCHKLNTSMANVLNGSNIAKVHISKFSQDEMYHVPNLVDSSLHVSGRLIMSGEQPYIHGLRKIIDVIPMPKELTDIIVKNRDAVALRNVGGYMVHKYMKDMLGE